MGGATQTNFVTFYHHLRFQFLLPLNLLGTSKWNLNLGLKLCNIQNLPTQFKLRLVVFFSEKQSTKRKNERRIVSSGLALSDSKSSSESNMSGETLPLSRDIENMLADNWRSSLCQQ